MNQPRLKNRGIIPHGGGWRITDPMTGVSVFGILFDQLVRKMKDVRRANGIPIGIEFEDEVEKWCCESKPDECQETDPEWPVVRPLDLGDIVRGSAVMMAHKLAGSPLVTRQEAERRAQICLGCKFNQNFAKPCSGICQELLNVVNSVTGHVGTQYDSQLHACGVCKCFLQASIWLPLDIQCKGVTDKQRAQFKNVPNCWKQCD
jgi:hypothetical protein